jgi:hypothetical protein
MRRTLMGLALLVPALPLSAIAADVATPVATYRFNNTFAADQGGVPALTSVDPLGAGQFESGVVFGAPRQVWAFDGAADPAVNQAGLSLNTTGLLAPTVYSVELVFLFTEGSGQWRRIIDARDRRSDTGFYVEPGGNLQVYPDLTGSTGAWTTNIYHHVVLANDGATVSAYLDGVTQFSGATGLMNLDNPDNPNLVMNFFLDNSIAGGSPNEFSDGRVALIRLWDRAVTADEVQRLAANPFIPEPTALALSASAAFVATLSSRRGRRLRRRPAGQGLGR